MDFSELTVSIDAIARMSRKYVKNSLEIVNSLDAPLESQIKPDVWKVTFIISNKAISMMCGKSPLSDLI